MNPILRAARRALEVTFVEPVDEGRPEPSTWSGGLHVVGWGTFALVLALTAVAAFSSALRQAFGYVGSLSTDRSIPGVVLPLFVLTLVWTLGLAHCAMIRLAWYLKIPAVLAGVAAMATLGVFSSTSPLVLGVVAVSYVTVLVLVIARRRRPYAWWEFPLITTLLGLAWIAVLVGPTLAAQTGADVRLVFVEAGIESLGALALPALVAAGVAPAIVTVTAAEAIATRALPRTLSIVAVLLLVAWRIVTTIRTMVLDPVEQGWGAVAAAVGTLAIAALGLALVQRLSHTRQITPPGDLPEIWNAWSFPFAVVLVGISAVASPIITLYAILATFKVPGADALSGLAHGLSNGSWQWWRAVPATVMVVVAIVLARRGREAMANAFMAFAAVNLAAAAAPLLPPDLLRARTADSIATVTSWIAIVTLAVTAAFGELTRRRAVGLVTVLLVGGLYTYRDTLDDPVSAVLGYAGLGAALFGLAWQAITGAGFTRADTPRLPQSTRVLAYLANTLFAFSIVAFVSVSRSTGALLSIVDLEATGDAALGTPLLVAATVLGLWYGFGAGERSASD